MKIHREHLLLLLLLLLLHPPPPPTPLSARPATGAGSPEHRRLSRSVCARSCREAAGVRHLSVCARLCCLIPPSSSSSSAATGCSARPGPSSVRRVPAASLLASRSPWFGGLGRTPPVLVISGCALGSVHGAALLEGAVWRKQRQVGGDCLYIIWETRWAESGIRAVVTSWTGSELRSRV